MATITLKLPTGVGHEPQPILVRRAGKTLGELKSRPKVYDGKLYAGKCILVARDHDLVKRRPGEPGMSAHFFRNGAGYDVMEVRYGAEVAAYKLYEDRVVYSDGPPHPDQLQLGIRISASGGVAEPQGT